MLSVNLKILIGKEEFRKKRKGSRHLLKLVNGGERKADSWISVASLALPRSFNKRFLRLRPVWGATLAPEGGIR